MQTAILIHCTPGMRHSLREAIASDPRLGKYELRVERQLKPGRNPGWAKLRSIDGGPGAINLEWDGNTRTLTARVVSRSREGPSFTIGRFVHYLLARHRRRIRTITLLP
jgi:hypothetical protein